MTKRERQTDAYLTNAAQGHTAAFHIGRGGHYYNPGFVTAIATDEPIEKYIDDNLFIGWENKNEVLRKIDRRENLENLFYESVEDSDAEDRLRNWGFDLGELCYLNCNGDPVGLTVEQAQTGIGRIDLDGSYDTTYVSEITELNEREYDLLSTAIENGRLRFYGTNREQIEDFIHYMADRATIEELANKYYPMNKLQKLAYRKQKHFSAHC